MAKNKAVQLVEEVTGTEYQSAPAGFVTVSYGAVLSKPGDTLHGTYVGPGPAQKVKGKDVPTYLVNRHSDGAEVKVLASAQVAQFFDSRNEGDDVWIQRRGQIKGGQYGRVNQFDFAFKPGK